MSDDPLAELRAADEGRTPGPWEVFDMALVSTSAADARFIALCGTHMTALLDRLRAAEAERDALVAEVERSASKCLALLAEITRLRFALDRARENCRTSHCQATRLAALRRPSPLAALATDTTEGEG